MDGRGRALVNIFVERLRRTVNIFLLSNNMNVVHIDKLISDVESVETVYVAGGADAAAIKQVEQELGFSFCSDYVEFLRKYGSIAVVDERLIGLHMDYFSDTSGGDVRCESRRFTSETGVPLDKKTVLMNFEGEGYVILDHSDGSSLLYDPFSKKYHSFAKNLEEAIEEFLKSHL